MKRSNIVRAGLLALVIGTQFIAASVGAILGHFIFNSIAGMAMSSLLAGMIAVVANLIICIPYQKVIYSDKNRTEFDPLVNETQSYPSAPPNSPRDDPSEIMNEVMYQMDNTENVKMVYELENPKQ